MPPHEIRVLRDYTRMRTDLTRERTRYWSRLEKLLEDSLIKVSAVASSLDTASARDMVEALIAGRRDPRALAELARGRMKHKRAALVEALTGRFEDHHAELARLLLDQIDALSAQIDPAGGTTPHTDRLHLRRLGHRRRQAPERSQCRRGKLSPRTIQSGAKNTSGKVGKGNPYLKGVLGQAAAVAARTDTFLGERFRRIVKRRGKLRALVAVARSLLVVIWHLLANPTAGFHDLGSDYYLSRLDTGRKVRSHVRQLEALGFNVTLSQTA